MNTPVAVRADDLAMEVEDVLGEAALFPTAEL